MTMEQGNVGTYEQVGLKLIQPSGTNPRKSFDAAALAELTESVRAAGVQTPILLRAWPKDRAMAPPSASAIYEIVCGERRFRAAAAAGLTSIPAIVRELSDDEAYQAQILENLQREDLGPMEEAESYAVLARAGGSAAGIALKVGKPGAYVAQRMHLLKLADKGRKALSEDKLPLGFALEIAKLAESEQAQALSFCLENYNRPTLASLKEYIQRQFRLQLSKAPFPLKDAAMHPEAGACVDCSKRTSADALLFSDVQGGDQCLDAKCFRVKVETIIHVRVEELKKGQATVPLISREWSVPKGAPAGTLGSGAYELVRRDKTCELGMVGVWWDGEQAGRRVGICVNKSCAVHHRSHSYGGSGSQADDVARRKKEAAKLKRDSTVRERTARAIVLRIGAGEGEAADAAQLSDADVNVEDALDLADYAFRRMDHAQDGRLAKVLGWTKDMVGYRGDERKDLLAGLGARRAMTLAVLATVAGDLNPNNGYGEGGRGLNDLAERHGVDVDAIEREVDGEIKSKAAGKKKAAAPAKKVGKGAAAAEVARSVAQPVAEPVAKGSAGRPAGAAIRPLSAEAKKRIADAMKKRWATRAKKAATKTAAKAGGRKKAAVRKGATA